jgi:predicted nucleotidyltransferase
MLCKVATMERLIGKIARGLTRRGIQYMIIGGQAVLVHGTPRLTRDIDITLGADIDKAASIKDLCAELGLKILPEDADKFINETMVLPAEDPETKMRVDFIFSFSVYERQAIARAVNVRLGSTSVRFASAEDLIIHKVLAGRAVDLEDVKNILVKISAKKLDVRYIKKWLGEFQKIPGAVSLVALFNKLLKENRQVL